MSLLCPTCKEDTAGRIQKVAVGGVTEVHCNICYNTFFNNWDIVLWCPSRGNSSRKNIKCSITNF